jgi:hypothetical protein
MPDKDLDISMIEEYYSMAIRFLLLKARRHSPNELKQLFGKDSQFSLHFSKMNGMIEEENFFDRLEKDIK